MVKVDQAGSIGRGCLRTLRGGRSMRARLLLGTVVLSLVALRLSSAGADEGPARSLDLRVLSTAGDAKIPPAREMLHRFLLDQARRHFDTRRKAIAAIKTPADIARRRETLRAVFLRS